MIYPVRSVLHLFLGGLGGLVWVFVEGNRSDLTVVQLLQLSSAALAAIMLGSCSTGFCHLSRLKAICACLTASPLEPRPLWWYCRGGHCATALFNSLAGAL